MYKVEVEIYDDTVNSAIMKHPSRNYPGLLVQGDSLFVFCQKLDRLCSELKGNNSDAEDMANDIRNNLWDKLNHYQGVLIKHKIEPPYKRI